MFISNSSLSVCPTILQMPLTLPCDFLPFFVFSLSPTFGLFTSSFLLPSLHSYRVPYPSIPVSSTGNPPPPSLTASECSWATSFSCCAIRLSILVRTLMSCARRTRNSMSPTILCVRVSVTRRQEYKAAKKEEEQANSNAMSCTVEKLNTNTHTLVSTMPVPSQWNTRDNIQHCYRKKKDRKAKRRT